MVWASIGERERDGLNVALNEATWLAADIDTIKRQARLLLDVLSLPGDAEATAADRVVVGVNRVSRIAASLRQGWWNDEQAAVDPLEIADLDSAVRSFGGCPIYGWQFIDPPEDSWSNWRNRLSADMRLGHQEAPHVLDLFQEGGSDSHVTSTCESGSSRSGLTDTTAAKYPCPSSSHQEFAGGTPCTRETPGRARRVFFPSATTNPKL